ncbi:MAG: hypothetical protein CVV02_07690 [Firmicutes bacterium HGW-Firmicutes-7]|nr:MAG: hypothetical protein CVV02_07690 [Firmicutes bacterium HGW-Firmicutes-7]
MGLICGIKGAILPPAYIYLMKMIDTSKFPCGTKKSIIYFTYDAGYLREKYGNFRAIKADKDISFSAYIYIGYLEDVKMYLDLRGC